MFTRYRLLVLAFWFMAALAAHAQTGSLRVVVLDSAEQRVIRDVTVGDANGRPLAITDERGTCTVRTEDAHGALRLSHVAYGTRVVRLDPTMRTVEVRWTRAMVLLDGAEVVEPGPEVVFRHATLDVAEFEVAPDGIWVLAYGRPRLLRTQTDAGRPIYRDVVLYLLNPEFRTKAWVPIAGDVRGLHGSYGGRIFLEADAVAFHCAFEHGAIVLHTLTTRELRDEVLPWTDSIPGWMLGNNATGEFPAFDHLAFDPERREVRTFCTVQDDFTMELFRSEYKYLSGHDKVVAMDLALRTGIDKQLIAGSMTGFSKHPYFHAPYAPLFVVGDTLCVFDHSCGAIRKFDRDLNAVSETPISYHLRNLWKGTLVQDAATGAVHVIERQGPSTDVRTVDPHTGEVGAHHRLEQRFPEQVSVNDGYAYYVYRPFGGEQTRWLYRELLR